ncbi:hypothetical protein RCF98_04515 [Thiothrix lacustris]|jgi:hypothetical protein|uniref:DUF2569 domain-containing protein n=1 Tax=Thiothrix lacustris TaxID=525917 RepID=A0ABY9MTX5_9GAMM|nr:hypothetical protein [Thiothrix lacustris]WML91605.1 hypothetical protein RCF98_04515 [Thiothrix lacustris]
MENPYTSPQSKVADVGNVERAKSPKVIGIILLILSSIALIGLAMNGLLITSGDSKMQAILAAQGIGLTYYYISTIIGAFTTLWLLYIGFHLVKYHDIGRKHFNYYFMFSLVISPLTALYQWTLLPEGSSISLLLPGMFGMAMGLLFYFIGWRYLNKEATKASLT